MSWSIEAIDKAKFPGFSCVYALGPLSGKPLRIGYTRDPKEMTWQAQSFHWSDIVMHHMMWFPDKIAALVAKEANSIMGRSNKALKGNWYEVTPPWAEAAIRIAADKIGVKGMPVVEMLDYHLRRQEEEIQRAMKR